MRPLTTLALLSSLAACGNGASPAPSASVTSGDVSHAAPTSLTHGVAKDLAVTWTDPPGWKKVPPSSPMRNTSYEVPAAAGDKEPGDLGVSFFGPDKPGILERNVKRWVDQFEGVEPASVKKSERKVNGLVQHLVEIDAGTFKSGMPGQPTTPKPDHALLGAIVETPAGSHFFKLVGPKATVGAAREAFFALLDSIKPR